MKKLVKALSVLFVLGVSQSIIAGAETAVWTDKTSYSEITSQYAELADNVPVFSEELRVSSDILKSPYQLPAATIANLTTTELAEVVLAYPYLSDVYAYNSLQEGLEAIRKTYLPLDLLLKRADAPVGLLEVYQSASQELGTKKAHSFNMKLELLEVILAQKELSGARDEITAVYSQVLDNKDPGIYGESLTSYLDVLAEQKITPYASDTTTTVKTPKGSNVTVIKYGSDLTDAKKTEINNSMAKNYPKASRLTSATKLFNCHSYAWYSSNTSTNKYWMNDPAKYMSDGSYKKQTGFKNGQKLLWADKSHSGIISMVYQGPPAPGNNAMSMVKVKSKWGQAGVYEHAGNYSPYTNNLGTAWQ